VNNFQRPLWIQVNKIDDHISNVGAKDRAELGDLTKSLTIISQNADSHISNTGVSIISASAIREAHSRLVLLLPHHDPFIHQRVLIQYLTLYIPWRSRTFGLLTTSFTKDSTLSLISGLALRNAHGIEEDSNRCQ
jgi:hypothetical protein